NQLIKSDKNIVYLYSSTTNFPLFPLKCDSK
ncbi:unnamed protein product, partial [marine sediment metagenome]